MDLPLLVRRAVQINRQGLATAMGDRKRTWQEFGDRVARLAAGLQGLGVERGDRVAILALNSDRYFEWFFASSWAGAVFVPVNTRLAPPEVAYWLNDSQSRVLFVDDHFAEMLPKLQGQLDSVRDIIHLGDGESPSGLHSYEGLIEKSTATEPAACDAADLAALYYTGGTTGRSKGVMLSHRNLVASAVQIFEPVEYSRDDVVLHVAPMFHMADGAMTIGSVALATGNCFVSAFEPLATLQAIAKHRVSRTVLVPTMINMLVHHPEFSSYDISSLRKLVYGASPMPEAVIRKALELMPNVRFFQGYGQTEAAPVLTVLQHRDHLLKGPHAARLKSAGQPVPGVEVAIFDDQDREVPLGEVGEICARGANVMMGYWNMPEATEKTLASGWLHTGDGGRMDEDGFVYVVDRVKDMIISGGENVYSAEVENAIYQHPTVAECAVIGIPHEKWGEQVHAIVRAKDGEQQNVDEAGLIAHCKDLIAGFKCPRSVEFRTEALPLSGAGKILKTDLRKPFWEGREKGVN